jgi:integrase
MAEEIDRFGPQKLTDTLARDLTSPDRNRIVYDGDHAKAVKGFGLRITRAGAKSWVLNYRAAGVERRLTIGSYPDWKAGPARDEGARLKRLVDQGRDPMKERHEERAAPTVADLAKRYLEEHASKKRTSDGDRKMLDNDVLPALGSRKVAAVEFADVEALHAKVTKRGAPIQANRIVSLLSKMFSLSMKWKMRADNPCRGIERNPENKVERYLPGEEMGRLLAALAARNESPSANIVRLALLTGARRGELLKMRWADIRDGVWIKPSAHTKQKKEHRLPLSAPARQLLAAMWEAAVEAKASKRAKRIGRAEVIPPGQVARIEPEKAPSPYVFPSRGKGDSPQTDLKKFWATICGEAGLGERVPLKDRAGKVLKNKKGEPRMGWRPTVRFHDLRHHHASMIANQPGASLMLVGKLLGHTQPATSQRYAHLFRSTEEAAVESIGAAVEAAEGKPSGEVVDHPSSRK